MPEVAAAAEEPHVRAASCSACAASRCRGRAPRRRRADSRRSRRTADAIRLCISDGTSAGTQVIDGTPNVAGPLCSHPGRVYFAATNANDTELWVSDGTALGTAELADINPSGSSSPGGFASLGDVLLFAATTDAGRELWKTDGTAAGTLRLTDIAAGSAPSNPSNLTCSADGQRLFFLADDDTNTGLEPWVSDGTVAGTTLIAYRSTGYGTEPFYSDGTAAGTQLLCDVQPGPLSSTPRNLTLFRGTLYFRATTERYGDELYGVSGLAHSQPMSADGKGPKLSTLRATPPLLGGTLSFEWTHGPDNWAGVLFIDFAQPPFPATFFANDSYGVVRIVSMLGVELVSQGEQSIAVPDIEVLLGVPANTQLWWIDPTLTSPYIEVSNGVALTFGR